MATIFSKIISGEIPAYKILENDQFLAFLDVFPLVKGHTLVIPKREIDYIFDLDDKELGDMMFFAKKVSNAIKSAYPCKKIGVSVVGLEVPHAHIHLIPINEVADMNFSKPKLSFTKEEMESMAESIKSYL